MHQAISSVVRLEELSGTRRGARYAVRSTYDEMMDLAKYQLRRLTAGLMIASLPMVGVALAPPSLADDLCMDDLDCFMSDDNDSWFQPGGMSPSSDNGGFEPGNLVIPATGGPPQVVVAPGPIGGPVVTAGGDVVVPGAPPIG